MGKGLPIVGASRKNGERDKHDFYPTPAYAVEALLKREKFEGNIWECACGAGDISQVLIEQGYEVYSTDIVNRGYGEQSDFFFNPNQADNIITNPPFSSALEFVNRAKLQSNKKIAMFLKTVFLESEQRYSMFQDKNFPLKTMYQFSKRVSLTKNGKPMKNSGMISFSWFVWDKDYKGKPSIEWIL